MKTVAAILTQLNAPLEIMELEIPPLQKGQVLVKIAYSGFCHSQLNEMKGLKGDDPYLPHTLGHEGSGTVLETGEGVTKVKAGDPVVLSWIRGSGHHVPSLSYHYRGKKINSGAISTFLTHAVISESCVIPIAKKMPLREAALFGCALPTGAGVIKNEMQIKENDSFALFGAGGVGLSALLAAKYMKASPIIVVDVFDTKLEKAKSFGATHLINAATQDPLKVILEITQGKGVDFAFECAGKKAAMESAFASIRAFGGLCVLAGNLPKGEKISLDPFDLIRGKRVIGTWGGKSMIEQDVHFYSQLFLQNQIVLDGLISHVSTLSQINTLAETMQRGELARGLIDLTNSPYAK